MTVAVTGTTGRPTVTAVADTGIAVRPPAVTGTVLPAIMAAIATAVTKFAVQNAPFAISVNPASFPIWEPAKI